MFLFFFKYYGLKTYITLLRGINVSGKNLLRMRDLEATFLKLGAQNVRTYIQSGNVVFHYAEAETKLLSERIKAQIKQDYGYDLPVLVLTLESFTKLINTNPFSADSKKDVRFIHVTFLHEKPAMYDRERINGKVSGEEEFLITDEAVFLYCPYGYGKTKLNNNFFESCFKVEATTRNWKTTMKLLEMAGNH